MKISFTPSPLDFASMGNVRQATKLSGMADSLSKQFDSKTIAENLERSRRADTATVVTDTSWQKTVPISEDAKKELMELVKADFTQRGGMSGDNSKYTAIVGKYLNTLPKAERPAALYTLSETFTGEAGRVRDIIKGKDPSWDFGKPVKKEILDEIFAKTPINTTA